MNKVKISALLVAALMIFGLFSASASNGSDDPINLTMVSWYGGGAADAITAKLNDYMDANPNVQITFEVWPWDQYPDKISIAQAGDALPDLIMADSGRELYSSFNAGAIRSLNSLAASGYYDFGTWLPGVQVFCSVGDDVVTFPFNSDQIITWYNKELFRQAGIPDLPNNPTWAELESAAVAVAALEKDADGNPIYGMEIVNSTVPWLYLAAKGINVVGAEDSFLMNTPEVTAAFEEIQAMLTRAGGPPAGQAVDPFLSGHVGIQVCWFGVVGTHPDFESGVVNAPVFDTVNGNYIFQAINGISLSSTTEYPEAAFDVAAYLMSEPVLTALQSELGIKPLVYGPAHDAASMPRDVFPFDAHQITAPTANSLGVPPVTAPWLSAVQIAISTNWPAFVGNSMTTQDFMTQLQTAYDFWLNAQ